MLQFVGCATGDAGLTSRFKHQLGLGRCALGSCLDPVIVYENCSELLYEVNCSESLDTYEVFFIVLK